MLIAVSLGVVAALTPGQVTNLTLYKGVPAAEQHLTVRSWGGGTAKEATDIGFAGTRSLMITTAGYFTGGMLNFESPIAMAELVKNKENLLQATIYAVENKGSGTSTGGRPVKQLENLRLVLKTSDGKFSEAVIPTGGMVSRWRQLGIPLTVIAGFAKTNQQVTSISLAGDALTTFYLGELRVVTDMTPIQGFLPLNTLQIGRDQEHAFTGSAEAGYSVIEYAWDFNEKDGMQDDAIGQRIFHRFRIPGEYTVTLTIRDVYGLKKPWAGKIKVTVWE